jgi:hypothetical protein
LDQAIDSLLKQATHSPFFFSTEYSISYELLRDDEDYVLNLYKIWPHHIVQYNIFYYIVSARLLQSIDFIKKILNIEDTVSSYLWTWEDFPSSFWLDKEFVMLAIKKNGCALQNTSEEFKNDKAIVSLAVEQERVALLYASEDLKNNKEIVLLAVKKFRFALKYVNQELKNDKEVILVAVKVFGNALEYASEKLKNDREIIVLAVRNNRNALRYASE